MKTRDSQYKRISYQDAHSNIEYARLVENVFNEQAAITIQRARRAKLKQEYKRKPIENINGTHAMRFLQEPWGLMSKQHAQLIKAGKWNELNFAEPDFVRNIYKALHQGDITALQLGTAVLLHSAIEEYQEKNAVQHYPLWYQYSLEPKKDNGPFDPNSVFYASEADYKDFYSRLKKLPPSDRQYFCFNLSERRTAGYLYDALTRESNDQLHIHFDQQLDLLFTQYINKKRISITEKERILAILAILDDKTVYSRTTRSKLRDELVKLEPHLQTWLESVKNEGRRGNKPTTDKSQIDRGSSAFLVSSIYLNEAIPGVILSPDHDVNDPNSPTISMLVFSLSALQELQDAVHKKDTTKMFLNAGKVSTRLIRYGDEDPGRIGASTNSRPIEMPHPDLKPGSLPHDFNSHLFMVIWHDLFHCWQNGANTYKPFIRHMRQLISTELGEREMTENIWFLSDMCLSVGTMRLGLRDKDHPYWVNRRRSLIEQISGKASGASKYIHYLLLVDLVINTKRWQEFTGFTPEEFYDGFYTKEMLKKLAVLKNLIAQDEDQFKSHLYYSLAYQLVDDKDGLEILNDVYALCAKTGDKRMHTVFEWNNWGSLLTRTEYGNKSLTYAPVKQLVEALTLARTKLLAEKNSASELKTEFSRKKVPMRFQFQGVTPEPVKESHAPTSTTGLKILGAGLTVLGIFAGVSIFKNSPSAGASPLKNLFR